MIFVCTEYPYLRILRQDGEYAQFLGGKLELDEDEPGYAEVLAEAQRNPAVSIHVNSTTCDLCGEVFEGKNAKSNFAKHVRAIHPDVFDAEQALLHARSVEQEVKSRAGFACDVCQPVQTFGSEADLAAHVTLLHTQPPAMDAEGNEIGGGRDDERRPGEVDPVPAARTSRNRK